MRIEEPVSTCVAILLFRESAVETVKTIASEEGRGDLCAITQSHVIHTSFETSLFPSS